MQDDFMKGVIAAILISLCLALFFSWGKMYGEDQIEREPWRVCSPYCQTADCLGHTPNPYQQ